MMKYIISDTHFYHKNIISYCNRPFNSVEYMNDFIIKKWNEKVTKKDIVYHLGDFALGWDKEKYSTKKECYKDLLSKLNGKKILIKGNHDKESNNFYLDIGFDEVYEYLEIGSILLIHYPIIVNPASKKFINEKILDFIKNFNISKYSQVYHGHIHNSSYSPKKHINVSAEVVNYAPIELNNTIF